jgi:outer membrane protein TolC
MAILLRPSLALGLLVLGAMQAPRTARAAPELASLITATQARALSVRGQAAAVGEREAATALERASLWPTLSVEAGYTRNQFDVVVQFPDEMGGTTEAPIVPQDQLVLTVQVTVPLLDLAARKRVAAAAAETTAARATLASTQTDATRAVVIAYHRWLGGIALMRAGRAAATAATATLNRTEARVAAQLSVELDVARARAQLAQARRAIAEAELIVVQARRELRTLTEVDVGEWDDAARLPGGLEAEAPLDAWLADLATLPEVKAARAAEAASIATRQAERATLVPRVSAFAREQVSNASGFGEPAAWAAGLTLSWQLDRSSFARIAAARARQSSSAVRSELAATTARDRVVDAWQQVEALRATAEASTTEVTAARLGAEIAARRLTDGTGTATDAVQAQSDQLAAEVAEIRARADLSAARALLRLAAGLAVDAPRPRAGA